MKNEPVKRSTRSSLRKRVKKEESDIEDIPVKRVKKEEIVIDDDSIITCSITGLSLSELANVRCEVMQEILRLPQHLRSRYYFEQSLEVKVQRYFNINDPVKLKEMSRKDPYN